MKFINNSYSLLILLSIFITFFTPSLAQTGSCQFTIANSGQEISLIDGNDMELGDLDGDGDLDAFLVNPFGDRADRVLLNNGAGQFTATSQLIGATFGYGVELGDLDGDGDLDAVVLNRVLNFIPPPAVEFWMNNGSGFFTKTLEYGFETDKFARDAAIGDVDNDGDLDVWIGLLFSYSTEDILFLNNGNGSFTLDFEFMFNGASEYHFGSNNVDLADLDGDGDLDAFTFGSTFTNSLIRIFRNEGNGSFTVLNPSDPSPGGVFDLETGDLDNDGDIDAFVSIYPIGTKKYLNNGTGTFSLDGATLAFGEQLDLADVGNDGDLDLLVSRNGTSQLIYLNNGWGTYSIGFEFDYSFSVGSANDDAEFGDLNGDGNLDVYNMNWGNDRVWFLNSTDTDNDGLCDQIDNCPTIANPNQENNDGDSQGDICDSDDDNDGTPDISDNCPFDPNKINPGYCGCGNPDTDADQDGFYACVDDCDDTNPAVHPQAGEICNGIDDDCDDLIDDADPDVSGQTRWYVDADSDGFGDNNNSILSCEQPNGYVAIKDDCDDTNPAINPNAPEICNDIDDDCSKVVDDGLPLFTYYPDADNDGFGVGSGQEFCQSPAMGYALQNGDCDDTNPQIFPGAAEICNNDLDDNCNGETDENCGPPLYVELPSCPVVYIGIPLLECVMLNATATGGTPPYSYQWSNGTTNDMVEVCPVSDQMYSVIVTDAEGEAFEVSVLVQVVNILCGHNDDKVFICHHPNGSANTLCITPQAAIEHLLHGDHAGPCGTEPCGGSGLSTIDQSAHNPVDERQDTPKDLARVPSIAIYPNPFTDQLTIDATGLSPGTVNIRIFDLYGKLIDVFELQTPGRYLWQVPVISTGLFIIKIEGVKLNETIKVMMVE